MLDRTVMRVGAIAAMVGAVIAVVFNLLHRTPVSLGDHLFAPRSEEFGAAEAVRLATEEGIWALDHYMLAWFLGLALFALVVVSRSFTGEPSVSWGRIARPFAVSASAVAFIGIVLDGWAITEAGEQVGGDVAMAVAYVSEALFIATIGALFGVTPLLYGIAVLSGDDYPSWLGWVAVIAGLVSIVAGSIIWFDGLSNFPMVLFLISSIVFTAWIGLMGWRLWQKSSALAPAAARTSA